MKFIEELRIAWERFFDQRPHILVFRFAVRDTVASQYSVRIRVDHEYCVLSGIQKNGIGRLRTDTVHGKQLLPEDVGRRREHSFQGAPIFALQKSHKGLQFLSLLPKISRGTHESRKLRNSSPRDC